MKQRLRSLALGGALALTFGAALLGPPTVAQGQSATPTPQPELEISRVFQTDQNGDGRMDLTTIESNFAGGADRIQVFDGGDDMATSEDWATATDFENDTWVFDVSGNNRAELVIQFARVDETRVEARLFDDDDGDGMVAYHVNALGQPVITETRFPRLTVTSWSTWTRGDGSLSYNLRFAQDGLFPGEEASQELSNAMKRDGRVDAETVFADEDGDGIPEYQINRLLAPSPESSGLHRMGVQMNAGYVRPRENAAAILWPLLGRGAPDRAGNYFDSAPTIEVDWTRGRVVDAGLIGYPVEQGFHVNALTYLLPDVRTVPNFENMMAYYDLDGDRDHRPELFIRHRYYEAGDRHGENVVPAANEIRYSWTDRNPNGLFWDYKFGLAGRHLITDTVRLGGFDLGVVPYERLPQWVAERTWDMATFVAREGPGYASSEGIYEWAPIEEKSYNELIQMDPRAAEQSRAAGPYLRGSIAIPPAGKFSGMRPGFRGEYSFEFGIRPLLYLSPVDRRLHLQKSSGGVWQVNQSSAVRYADTNRDGWLDSWTYVEVDSEGQITETRELHVLTGFLVYGDSGQLVLRKATVKPSVYEAVAPTTGDEARAIKGAVDALGKQPAAGDLRQMQQQFEGEEQRISGVQITEFRALTGGGFRFVLDVKGPTGSEGPQFLDLRGVRPGRYVVASGSDGVFSLDPLTEASFALDFWGESEAGRMLTADTSGLVRISVTNFGLRDAPNLTVRLERVSSDGVSTMLGDFKTDVLAGEPFQMAIPWQPARSGPWTVRLWAEDATGKIIASETREVQVQRRSAVTGPIATQLPSTEALFQLSIPLLFMAIGFGVVVALLLRSSETRRRES